MNEQSQRLNKTIDLLTYDKTRIEAVETLINMLAKQQPIFYQWCKEANDEYKQLSANYVSHLLSGNDSICERYKCRDTLEEYKGYADLYCNSILDEIWLHKELAALRIVELCRTGL
jgi:hypothetical protein